MCVNEHGFHYKLPLCVDESVAFGVAVVVCCQAVFEWTGCNRVRSDVGPHDCPAEVWKNTDAFRIYEKLGCDIAFLAYNRGYAVLEVGYFFDIGRQFDRTSLFVDYIPTFVAYACR